MWQAHDSLQATERRRRQLQTAAVRLGDAARDGEAQTAACARHRHAGDGAEVALAAVTIDAARLIGVADRIGSLEPGKDADLALYDGDPFEYTTHCTNVVINGGIFPGEPRE